MNETRTTKKSSAHALEAGDKWSRHSYGTVIMANSVSVSIENEHGLKWSIDTNLFEKEFNVADQFESTERITRTEMVEKITSAARLVMTVHFRKKPDHKDLVAAVTDLLDGKVTRPKPRSLSSLLKKVTAGEERTMIGRHHGSSDEFGRLQFTAMEKGGGLRLIDPRTVEWCIIDNIRYKVK